MKEKEKIFFYKYGSIALIVFDLIMLYKCIFFEISEKLISYLRIGEAFLGGIGSFTSEALQSALNSLSNGKITIWEFQKIYAALEEYSSDTGEAYITQIFYWLIVIFVVAGIVEIVIHIFNGKFNGLFCLADILFCSGVLFLYWALVRGDDENVIAIRFTPWAIAIMVLPIIATVFWGLYRSMAGTVKMQANFNAEEWGKVAAEHKNIVIVLALYFGLHIVPMVFGISVYEELFYKIISIVHFVDFLLIGMMIIYAFYNEWKILVMYVMANLFGNLILYYSNLQYYNFRYLVYILGSGLIIALCIYFLMQMKFGKYKLAIVCGGVILIRAFLIPLYVYGYFSYGYYESIMTILGNRDTVFMLAGILCPILIYVFKPNYMYRFMNFKADSDLIINNEEKANYSEKSDSFVEMKQIEIKLKETRKKIENSYVAIGEKLCDLGYDNDDTYKECKDRIENLKEENMQIKERMNYINGIRVCPSCYAKNKLDSIFCMKCGKKL